MLPVDLLTVCLVDLVALLPVGGLLHGVVLQPTPHALLLVLPVTVMAVTQHGGHGAQDNLHTVEYFIDYEFEKYFK